MLLADGRVDMPHDLTLDVGDMFAFESNRLYSPQAAFLWYSRAAKSHPSHFISVLGLAACYEAGFGVPVNAEQAERLLKDLKDDRDLSYWLDLITSSAENRNAMSEYFLALLFKYGIGVDVDAEKAMKLKERAKQDGSHFFSKNQSKRSSGE